MSKMQQPKKEKKKMTDTNELNIYTMDIEELWNLLLEKIEEEDEDTNTPYKTIYAEEINNIKEGYRLKCRINYLFPSEDCLIKHHSSKKATIKGHGKYQLNDVEDEIDQRKATMRKIINATQKDNTNTRPRTIEEEY